MLTLERFRPDVIDEFLFGQILLIFFIEVLYFIQIVDKILSE